MSIYHEKQVGNYCRLHAINNLIGKKLVSRKEFDNLCDSYDKFKKYVPGTSKRKYYFINNGGLDNIFGYVLTQKGYKIDMHHYSYHKRKIIKDSDISFGCIAFNRCHTFCIKRINGELYKIDSMARKPVKIKISQFLRKGFGLIRIDFKNLS